jgi:Ca2+-binding RTX toxin-like protein
LAVLAMMINGGIDKDTLHGDAGADVLAGDAGDDSLWGDDGNDTLAGGAGTDTLVGGLGDDSYRFGRGDGSDLVDESGLGGTDTIALATGVLVADVNLYREGSDLVAVTAPRRQIRFATISPRRRGCCAHQPPMARPGMRPLRQGICRRTPWSAFRQLRHSYRQRGRHRGRQPGHRQRGCDLTLGADIENLTLTGPLSIDGSATLNNILVGNGGNNVLDGVSGNDTLRGGAGDDTYVVTPGGADTVVELASEGTDTVWANNTYVLPSNVENLAIGRNGPTSTSKVRASGNALDNVINARQHDIIDAPGADVMIFDYNGSGRSITVRHPRSRFHRLGPPGDNGQRCFWAG